MCKIWVWTAPAWSDCMYTLPKTTLEMELKITFFLTIFETFTGEGQSCCQGTSMGCHSCCQGMSMGCQGAPRDTKRCQGMPMGCQAGPPGHQKDAKESNSINNAKARGENLRWMLPRCFPDGSRCLPDASRGSQMPPRCLQMPPDASRSSQMLSRCLPDASRCLLSVFLKKTSVWGLTLES